VIIRRPSADNLKSCAIGFRLPLAALSGFVAAYYNISITGTDNLSWLHFIHGMLKELF